MSYNQDYWERETQARQRAWDKSKDVKWVVRMNTGGGLWEQVIEVRHIEDDDNPGEYYCRAGNTRYEALEETPEGNQVMGFMTERDAEHFLGGAKFFRQFMLKYFIKG